MLNDFQKEMLKQISDLHEIPQGAISLRVNGENKILSGSKNIRVVKKIDIPGFTASIMSDTVGKSLHVPVLIDTEGINEEVTNTFNIGHNCDIVIVAGCGIHNEGNSPSSHKAKHIFYVGKNSHVKYIERHVATGEAKSKKEISPNTEIFLDENSVFEIETTQIAGVNLAERMTNASLQKGAKLLVKEKIFTDQNHHCNSTFVVILKGENASAELINRSVAKNTSSQSFLSTLIGITESYGRVECDGILLDKAMISSAPTIMAKNPNAHLSHEAQIGKIAGEQLIKLMTLGLTKEQAEAKIIKGFMNS